MRNAPGNRGVFFVCGVRGEQFDNKFRLIGIEGKMDA
jgi:hypothetical protein